MDFENRGDLTDGWESESADADRELIVALRNDALPTIGALLAEIKELKAWIPVGERLPEEGQSVFVHGCDPHDGSEPDSWIVGWYSGLDMAWVVSNGITHWRPLPEPPDAGGEA